MRTTINGKPARWTPEIRAAWATLDVSNAKSANWYTARPYQDQYSRGSELEGFVWIAPKDPGLGQHYLEVYFSERIVPKPAEPYVNPRFAWVKQS